jgi:hypothetical protein
VAAAAELGAAAAATTAAAEAARAEGEGMVREAFEQVCRTAQWPCNHRSQSSLPATAYQDSEAASITTRVQ